MKDKPYLITGYSEGTRLQESYYFRKPVGIKRWYHTEEARSAILKPLRKHSRIVTEEEYDARERKPLKWEL